MALYTPLIDGDCLSDCLTDGYSNVYTGQALGQIRGLATEWVGKCLATV